MQEGGKNMAFHLVLNTGRFGGEMITIGGPSYVGPLMGKGEHRARDFTKWSDNKGVAMQINFFLVGFVYIVSARNEGAGGVSSTSGRARKLIDRLSDHPAGLSDHSAGFSEQLGTSAEQSGTSAEQFGNLAEQSCTRCDTRTCRTTGGRVYDAAGG
jgi:hypothetical protein